MPSVLVSSSFDDLRSRQVRFLEEAAKLGEVHVALWDDLTVTALTGQPPKFSQAERLYLVDSIRYTTSVALVRSLSAPDALPLADGSYPDFWVVEEQRVSEQARYASKKLGIEYVIIPDSALAGFPWKLVDEPGHSNGRPRVLVSGCYDWLHSGHVRFFEEVSALGKLYVAVGNDANVQHLKGPGHPLFSQEERCYMVQAVRFVHQAVLTSGWDWLDYAPEIDSIQPAMFAVNEDGDKPEKRQLCEERGVEYVVLKRTPKEGLPRRESTRLRGF